MRCLLVFGLLCTVSLRAVEGNQKIVLWEEFVRALERCRTTDYVDEGCTLMRAIAQDCEADGYRSELCQDAVGFVKPEDRVDSGGIRNKEEGAINMCKFVSDLALGNLKCAISCKANDFSESLCETAGKADKACTGRNENCKIHGYLARAAKICPMLDLDRLKFCWGNAAIFTGF